MEYINYSDILSAAETAKAEKLQLTIWKRHTSPLKAPYLVVKGLRYQSDQIIAECYTVPEVKRAISNAGSVQLQDLSDPGDQTDLSADISADKIESMSISEARKLKGVTQKEVSASIGIPYRTLQDWEQGKHSPPKWIYKLLIREILRM